jgi:hypothetical protein
MDSRKMDIVESTYTTLRAIGKDEAWLHNWIKEKPSHLGLGELTIVHSELSQYKDSGGRLDILAYRADLDTYYEIEGHCQLVEALCGVTYSSDEHTSLN